MNTACRSIRGRRPVCPSIHRRPFCAGCSRPPEGATSVQGECSDRMEHPNRTAARPRICSGPGRTKTARMAGLRMSAVVSSNSPADQLPLASGPLLRSRPFRCTVRHCFLLPVQASRASIRSTRFPEALSWKLAQRVVVRSTRESRIAASTSARAGQARATSRSGPESDSAVEAGALGAADVAGAGFTTEGEGVCGAARFRGRASALSAAGVPSRKRPAKRPDSNSPAPHGTSSWLAGFSGEPRSGRETAFARAGGSGSCPDRVCRESVFLRKPQQNALELFHLALLLLSGCPLGARNGPLARGGGAAPRWLPLGARNGRCRNPAPQSDSCNRAGHG